MPMRVSDRIIETPIIETVPTRSDVALTLELAQQGETWRVRIGLARDPADIMEVCWLPVMSAEDAARILDRLATIGRKRNGKMLAR